MSSTNPGVLAVYVDVDDTFVRTYGSKRIPITSMIEHIRALSDSGAELYCWSSGGAEYARISATEFGIAECFRGFLPKPQVVIDDQLITEWRGLKQLHPNECAGASLDRYRDLVPILPSLVLHDSSQTVPKVLNKIGVIGDVHAQDDLLELALQSLISQHLDAILCTGDIVDGAGNAERCFELIRDTNVLTVRGNHDRWLAQDSNSLTKLLTDGAQMALKLLPPTRRFATPAGRLLLCHGLGQNDMRELRPDQAGADLDANFELQQLRSSDYSLVINGHTHLRMVRDYTGIIVINAGTLRADRDPVFATIDFVEKLVQYYGFDSENRVISREAYAF